MKTNTSHYILDIGNYSLKLLKFNTTKNNPSVLATRILPLKFNISEELIHKTHNERLAVALDQLFSQEPKTARKNISVLLSDNIIFTRFVTLPNIPRSKLRQIISFEAEQQSLL